MNTIEEYEAEMARKYPLRGSWSIVIVPKSTPTLFCTQERLKTSRSSFGKNAREWDEEIACEEHEYPCYQDWCNECKIVHHSTSEEDALDRAIDHAKYICGVDHRDVWVVDSLNGKIMAAFTFDITRIV